LAIARFALSAKAFSYEPAVVARGYLDVLILVSLVALFLITFVIRTFYIPSVSMVPTLQVRDVLLADEIAYRLHGPTEGDVALFAPPHNSGHDDYVKRVIGVPGDAIAISDGTVYRNGSPLREPYENQPPRYDLGIRRYTIYVDGKPLDPRAANIPAPSLWQKPDRIPDGFYFVLGDNRNYSDDSHVWGFVRASSFVARAFLILWPLNRLRSLERWR
jgi:signal peptidase I